MDEDNVRVQKTVSVELRDTRGKTYKLELVGGAVDQLTGLGGTGAAVKITPPASFRTSPILLVVFILLGFVAGVKTMLRTAAEMAGPADGTPGSPARNRPDDPAGNKPDDPARNRPDHPAGTKGTQRGD